MKTGMKSILPLMVFIISSALTIAMSCGDKGNNVEEPDNHRPNINSAATVMALIDEQFSYTATATDADGTTPAIHFENIPSWLDTSGNVISGTPTSVTPDTSFRIIAADDDSLADTLAVTVDVVDALLTVSYASDIQPIFNAGCAGSSCHIGGNANGLRLNDRANLMQGGNSGDVVIPGDAENSILIKRLDGRLTPRMPFGGSALPTDDIQTIRDWIDEGALDN